MPEDWLATLAAQTAVRRLWSLYCDALSRRDPDAIGPLFTPDAIVQIAGGPERIGQEAIVAGLRASMTRFSFLHQKCDASLIDIIGDSARARINVMEANREMEMDSLTLIFGAYEDEYRLLDAGWRFHRRRFTLQFRAVVPTLEMQAFPDFMPAFGFVP